MPNFIFETTEYNRVYLLFGRRSLDDDKNFILGVLAEKSNSLITFWGIQLKKGPQFNLKKLFLGMFEFIMNKQSITFLQRDAERKPNEKNDFHVCLCKSMKHYTDNKNEF